MKNLYLTLAFLLSVTAGCDESVDSDFADDVSSRSICEDVPAPGTPGGPCYIGYECDAGAMCSMHTLGFVCAAECSPTAGCDCGTSCSSSGLCETQCKGNDDCAEGMVCDGFGDGAPVCIWPALAAPPAPAEICWLSGFTWGPCGLDDQCSDGDVCVETLNGKICAPACGANGCPADLLEDCGPGHCTPSGLCVPN